MKTLLVSLAVGVAASLAGCASMLGFKAGEDSQTQVDQRVKGMALGDFLQRYGAPLSRTEANDGSLSVVWESGLLKSAPGPYGPEALICRLRLSADSKGRIVAVQILRDGDGQRRLSRCVELLDRS